VSLPAVAVWHDIECGAYSADIPLWQSLAAVVREQSGLPCQLLELGSGTGRVSLAMASDDCQVTALDIDPELIAVLRRRAKEREKPVDARVGDACSFDLESTFDVVLAPMLFAQLLDHTQRLGMLASIARHLRRDGCAALALLELDEEWETDIADAPPPDTLEKDGWVYSSHAVALRQIIGEDRIELDRVRRTTTPQGEQAETLSRISLDLVSPAELEAEANTVGLVARPRRRVQATEEHVANTIVILARADG
jgi:SAM-dependent methyltransferase